MAPASFSITGVVEEFLAEQPIPDVLVELHSLHEGPLAVAVTDPEGAYPLLAPPRREMEGQKLFPEKVLKNVERLARVLLRTKADAMKADASGMVPMSNFLKRLVDDLPRADREGLDLSYSDLSLLNAKGALRLPISPSDRPPFYSGRAVGQP